MSDVRWTPEQEQAITARGADVLVAAAAGSGKTAVLVERIIRRLVDERDPLDVDQLLVVTFTEAAATEMRDRIGAALQAALAGNPENERLQRQLALLGRASISTLHSFCLSLVRQYFYRLGLDPAVSVMGEHEALLLRHEVLDQLFARRFDEEEDGPFHALVDRYGGGRDDEGLRNLVLAIYDHMQALPWPDQWLEESLARFDVPEGAAIEDLPWWPPLRRQIRLELELAAEALASARALAARPGGPAAYLDVLAAEEAAVRAAAARTETGSYADLAEAVAAVAFGRLPGTKKGEVDEGLKEAVGKLRERAKKAVRAVQEQWFCRTADEWLADLRAIAPHLRTLGGVVREFAEAFREAKAAQSAIDFNDLERLALQLLRDSTSTPDRLVPSDVARDLRARYREILVDEYQDINGVQDAILTLVARDGQEGPPNRFMVGDVKQSIYRFRHADPGLFLAKYGAYRPWAGAPEPGAAGARIVLGANFRSREGVVNAVNFLFRQIMSARAGELDYDRDAELVYRAGYPPLPGEEAAEPPVELHLLDGEERGPADGAGSGQAPAASGPEAASGDGVAGEADGEEEDPALAELADLTAMEREARLIAARIRAMVDGTADQPPVQVWDRKLKTYRPLQYRDIAILLRATTGRINTMIEVLSQSGIPAYGQVSTGYFQATEVQVFLSLLQVLDNPLQDIPLAAVLHSPIVGLSAADLARIRLANPRGSFYDALVAAAAPASGAAMAEAAAAPASEAAMAEAAPAPASGAAMAEAAAAADPAEAGATTSTAPGLEGVLVRFLECLDRWRTLARRRPLSQVVWQILQETGYLHYVGGMPGGAQRQANLLALYERAREFDQFARQGLFRFLRFIERLQAEQSDMGTAPALGEGEDVVRIMSIHKSKGLEFPVVFVAGLGSSFSDRDLRGDLLLNRDLGFGPQVVDPGTRLKYPTLAYHAVREVTRLANLAEELRVLYVALTRARERLVLVGSVKSLRAACARWSRGAGAPGWPLPESLLLSARSYLDWIGPAVLRHADGAPLRELAGEGGTAPGSGPDPAVAGDPSRWEVTIWDPASLQQILQPRPEAAPPAVDWARIGAAEPLDRPLDEALHARLRARFGWRYPFEPVVRRFGKLSVTELKGYFDPDAEAPAEEMVPPAEEMAPPAEEMAPPAEGSAPPVEEPAPSTEPSSSTFAARPRFLQQDRRALSPTERGTAVHVVMQHLDLSRPLDAEGVGRQLAEMVERELLTPQQAAAVDAEAIADFFASPLGLRILQSRDRVSRELSFTLAVPAAEVYGDLPPEAAAGDVVIVQGMVDLLLEEEDGYVLVDYKTDRRDPVQAAQRYTTQIRFYRRAVEEILGRPVKEAYLHFLASRRSIAV